MLVADSSGVGQWVLPFQTDPAVPGLVAMDAPFEITLNSNPNALPLFTFRLQDVDIADVSTLTTGHVDDDETGTMVMWDNGAQSTNAAQFSNPQLTGPQGAWVRSNVINCGTY